MGLATVAAAAAKRTKTDVVKRIIVINLGCYNLRQINILNLSEHNISLFYKWMYMLNPYEKPNNKDAPNQIEKYAFIFNMYNLALKDREIIQSKLKFFIGLSISSLLSIFFFIEKFQDAYFFEKHGLTKFFIFNLIILHIFCFYFIFKVFGFIDYKEISDLKKKDLKKNLNTFYKENNHALIESFNRNEDLNIQRRKDIKFLFILYYIIGILHLIWFSLYLIWKTFSKGCI